MDQRGTEIKTCRKGTEKGERGTVETRLSEELRVTADKLLARQTTGKDELWS